MDLTKDQMADECNWLSENAQAIVSRLAWLTSKRDGWVLDRKSQLHRIVIDKEGSEIRLHFLDPHSTASEADDGPGLKSGRMSEIDLTDPLFLIAPYTQALILPLIWNSTPESAYMIGFGGGRVPMVLHHYFPHIRIESTEIDPEVLKVAASHFGILYDGRQKTTIQDGREYLNQRPPSMRYDFILNDAFRGTGYGPVHLSTREFYADCKRHLVEGGIVAVNLVESDPIFLSKVNTIRASFKSAYLLVDEDATVVFGTDAERLMPGELIGRAQAIQERHCFRFDFMRKARALKELSECGEFLKRVESQDEVLTDDSIGPLVEKLLKPNDPIFFNVGRNDICPCGSGKKFKRCHGR